MSLVRAKSALAIYCLCALAAQGQERLTSKDLSFFEYLGSMVEKDGAWVLTYEIEASHRGGKKIFLLISIFPHRYLISV